MSKKEKKIEKCSHSGCYRDAIWTATISEGAKAKNYKPTPGTYYYCQYHRDMMSLCTTMEFEKL